MSLLTRQDSFLIGASAAFVAGTAELVSEEPSLTEHGWDTLTQVWATRRASLTAEELAAAYPIGSKLTDRNWWIVSAKPGQRFAGLVLFELTFKGWGSTKPVKITWGSAAEQQSASNIMAPPPGGGANVLYAQVQTQESTPTFSASYLVNGISDATTPILLVGRAHTRTEAPPVGASIWGWLTKFVYHWPNGWVLMDLSTDIIPGTLVGLVTENYKYVRAISP